MRWESYPGGRQRSQGPGRICDEKVGVRDTGTEGERDKVVGERERERQTDRDRGRELKTLCCGLEDRRCHESRNVGRL